MTPPKVLIVEAGFAGFHYALPSLRARMRTAADWFVHATLSGGDAWQTAAAILADDHGGWPA